jgi:hypothetical protein
MCDGRKLDCRERLPRTTHGTALAHRLLGGHASRGELPLGSRRVLTPHTEYRTANPRADRAPQARRGTREGLNGTERDPRSLRIQRNSAMTWAWTATVASRSTTTQSEGIVASEQPAGLRPACPWATPGALHGCHSRSQAARHTCCAAFVMNTERHSRWVSTNRAELTVIAGRCSS